MTAPLHGRDENVVGEYHVVGKHQKFETPAGTAHVRDNWKIVSMLLGVVSGRAWYAVGVSPGSANFGPVETFSATGNLTYKPLAAGPTWQELFVAASRASVSLHAEGRARQEGLTEPRFALEVVSSTVKSVRLRVQKE